MDELLHIEAGGALAPSTIDYSSERLCCLIRGSNQSLQPNIEFSSQMGPGIYVTAFIHGNTTSGSTGVEMKALSNSLYALAIRSPMLWRARSGTVPVRAIGVAVEGPNIERLGLGRDFDGLFGSGEMFRQIQVAADFRTIEQACQMLKTDIRQPTGALRLEANGLDIFLKGLALLKQASGHKVSVLRARLLALCDAVEADLSRQWSMADFARIAGSSVRSLSTQFQREFGKTPFAFLRERRLFRARDLLLNEDMRIADVARIVGFSTAAHFSVAFRRQFGVLPGALKRSAPDT